jgi:predicted lipoprotein with Yx(FWY)xxD motif
MRPIVATSMRRCQCQASPGKFRKNAQAAARPWNKTPSGGVCADVNHPFQEFTMRILMTAAALLVASSLAWAQQAPTKTQDGALVGPNGMSLYTFDKDEAGSGKSACNGPCSANWPALAAASGDQAQGEYSIIRREDGTSQWAYKGKPLYFWVKDAKPGDRSGDGVNQVWHLARP